VIRPQSESLYQRLKRLGLMDFYTRWINEEFVPEKEKAKNRAKREEVEECSTQMQLFN